jgi:adenylylsulfate kinase
VAPDSARDKGGTIWLTGLPSSGKSTLALHSARRLRAVGHRVEILDGDEIRARLGFEGRFSKADRNIHVRRVGWLARLLARNGVKVLVPVIAPYADIRAVVRDEHVDAGVPYLEIHVATPLEVCVQRDHKGLYAKQRAGLLSGLTGVDDPYDVPQAPDLRLSTEGRSVDATVAELVDLLVKRGLV